MRARAAAALAAAMDAVAPARPDAWRFTTDVAGTPLAGEAVSDGDWLDLTVPAAEPRAVLQDWRALERNAALPAGVRLVAAAGGVGLRVDVPIAADVDAVPHLRAAVGALAAAAGLGGAPAIAGAAAPPATDAAPERIAAMRFAAAPRGADEWTVDLAVPDFATRAVVRRAPDATLAVAVALVDEAPRAFSEAGRRAVARLLGRVATLVRLARPAVDAGAPASLRFEALGVRADAAALDHACGALAAACRLAAVETTALLVDDTLARRFLALDPAAAVARAA
ncbi:MAG: hypothetical protein IT294_17305 [Deltaproteobacteria bacterium]|nr:hypothetical protein [Deltaproteobacteria bacterium]